jgi:hypothetical protein
MHFVPNSLAATLTLVFGLTRSKITYESTTPSVALLAVIFLLSRLPLSAARIFVTFAPLAVVSGFALLEKERASYNLTLAKVFSLDIWNIP